MGTRITPACVKTIKVVKGQKVEMLVAANIDEMAGTHSKAFQSWLRGLIASNGEMLTTQVIGLRNPLS